MSNDELVAVMVPKRHLAKVYGLIARLDEFVPSPDGSSAAGPNSFTDARIDMDATMERMHGRAAEFASGDADDVWSDSLILRSVRESAGAMKGILRALAERPDQWVSTSALASAISHKPNADRKTVAGTLGAFGRRVKSRYNVEKLPFDGVWDHTEHCKLHRMSADMAHRMLAALNDSNDRN
ncbi:MAG TPA: hypothetical protein VH107_04740 [Lacipirellulaceae bacterium]|nr:hypothetical protein [Lacipirellulaceae bacterium]